MKTHLVLAAILVFAWFPPSSEARQPASGSDARVARAVKEPLVRVVDLNLGESIAVKLADDREVLVKLHALKETRDPIRQAVRGARLDVEVDGRRFELDAGPYRLPVRQGNVQVDCTATKGLNTNGTPGSWGLDKDARLRVWPGDSPWIEPGAFVYPVRQRWFATHTQMFNEPTYVDGGEPASSRNIYYHNGLDIGGSEGQVEVVAATKGLVVSVGDEVAPEHRRDTPVSPRYDVIYLLDSRGWYYRYSHLKSIDKQILIGRGVEPGQRLGWLGKEGGSGGWSHLHFEINARQPSGKWGTQDGYAFLWQAYHQQHESKLVAVARPHHLARVGDRVELDASRSWSATNDTLEYHWTFGNGETATGPRVTRTYDTPGMFSEVLRVRDQHGGTDYDFAVVQVLDPQSPTQAPPTIHPAYFPTLGIKPGQEISFKVRSFQTTDGVETWDFGDGSPTVAVRSDSRVVHAPDGYAETSHRFAAPGQYIVKVQRSNARGESATAHLRVCVDKP